MITRHETFKKYERLCSRKIIAGLFENGNVFYVPFYKVIWAKSEKVFLQPAQVAFSVPKRDFRQAVTRNLLKRRIREAYRKHKHILYEFLRSENIRITFIVIFRYNSVPGYLSVEKSMKELISKFKKELKKNNK
jgi:ribonuclease P protein component